MKRLLLSFCGLMLCTPLAYAGETSIPSGTYKLDKSHASLIFTVSHIGFSNYTMSFDAFDATLELDPSHPEKASVKATIDPLSIDLPSPPKDFTETITTDKNWLNAKQYPKITYTSQKVKMTGEKTADIYGELELLGVKKPVVLHATFNGGYRGHPMDPQARIGFTAKGAFKRSDFGMNYGIPEPGTTMGVSDEVSVIIDAEFSGPPMDNATKQ